MRILLTFFLSAFVSSSVFAHGNDSHHPNKQDVTVKTTKVAGNVYMLQGRGGNIGVLTGPDGILMIDDDYRTVAPKLAAALKELGGERPRFVLNTHWHGDHTEGNYIFGKDATIVAHVNVRKRLMAPPMIFGRETPAYPAFALPVVTYTESMSLHLNGEEIRLVHYPNGHTDGDSVVFFENSKVVHLGDTFFVGRFPFVDIDSGGSVQGLIRNVASLIAKIPADAKIIPGHGPLATHADLKAYHSLVVDSAAHIEGRMKAGKSLDEIKKEGMPEKFKEAGSGFINNDSWITIVHRSYSQK
jgi:cyclase